MPALGIAVAIAIGVALPSSEPEGEQDVQPDDPAEDAGSVDASLVESEEPTEPPGLVAPLIHEEGLDEIAGEPLHCDGGWALVGTSLKCLDGSLRASTVRELSRLPSMKELSKRHLRRDSRGRFIVVDSVPLGMQFHRFHPDGRWETSRELPNFEMQREECGDEEGECIIVTSTVVNEPEREDRFETGGIGDFRAEGPWQIRIAADDGLCIDLFDRNLNAASEGVWLHVNLDDGAVVARGLGDDRVSLPACEEPADGASAPPLPSGLSAEGFFMQAGSLAGDRWIHQTTPVAPGDYAHSAYFLSRATTDEWVSISPDGLGPSWTTKQLARLVNAAAAGDEEWLDEVPTAIVEYAPSFVGNSGELITMAGRLFSAARRGESIAAVGLPAECKYDRTLCGSPGPSD